ncbi:MAG: UDP-N-acetylmuramate dehydrogenase [Candidatus Bathyarchaeia archaeon]
MEMIKLNRNKELLTGIKGTVLFNEPLRNHTTLRIGGPADILVIPKDLDDIKYCIAYAQERRMPLYFIGNGSKLLISDKGLQGIVLKIAGTLDSVEVSGERIIAGAGCSLSKLIQIALQYNLAGIEFAAGIPGTLGGAIAMNAGTYLGSISDVIISVAAMDPLNGSLHLLARDDCCFGYRHSIFLKKRLIIIKSEMKMKKGDQKDIREKINELIEKRKKTQPLDMPNAGSIFKNPPGASAGKLIEMAGLKGVKRGGAQISEVHANFIVNLGNAKAEDVIFLIRLAQEKVKEKFNIALEPEILLMGDFE